MTHQITYRGETSAEIFLRVGEGQEGAIFAGVVNRTGERRTTGLNAIETEAEDMSVPINQARQHRHFAQIDYLSTGGNFDFSGRSNSRNPFSLDHDNLIVDKLAGL